MKFSVILPVYKVEKYLCECVDSILGQTYTDFEVILVDDGSPDSCPQICEEYARKDDRVKVLHKENGGQASARNAGLDIAKGEYICFVDSDDYWIDNSVLERLAEKTVSVPDIIHFKFVEWFENSGKIQPCRFDYQVRQTGRSLAEVYCDLIDKDAYYNSAWSKAIRRSLLVDHDIRFEEGIVGEDNEWYYHVVMAAQDLILINEPLYVYRRRCGSTTTSATEKNLRDQLHVLDKWEKLLAGSTDDIRSQVVWGSLAKQYCSAIILYAGLQDVEHYYSKLKKKSYLLKYSRNKRVVIFRWGLRLLGLRGFIATLRLYRGKAKINRVPRILISDRRKCPTLDGAVSVSMKSIRTYEGNKEVEALICSRDVAQVAQHMNIPNLKVIQLFSAGFDHIEPKLLKEKGVHLCNAANVYNVGMAEFVVYAMLMHAKRYHHSIKNRHLRLLRNYHYITELAGKTVGILGAGNIGGQIAKRLEAFDMHVLGYDLKTDDRPHFEKVYNQEDLADFLGQCDYIVNCMPLFPSTEGMLCKAWFDLMKKTVTIVNVGRKKLINDRDLIAFLKKNKDATAVLDMFEKVPNPFTNPYRRLSNVLVLPGVTAISQEINQKLAALISENMKRLKSGEPLINQIV